MSGPGAAIKALTVAAAVFASDARAPKRFNVNVFRRFHYAFI